MQMEMEPGLAGAAAVIEDGPVPRQEMTFLSKLCRDELQFSEQTLLGRGGVMQCGKVFTRADENVSGGLRTDVLESEDVVILIDDLGWNFLGADLAEQAILVHYLTPDAAGSSRRTTKSAKPSLLRSCSPKPWAASSPEILPTRTR